MGKSSEEFIRLSQERLDQEQDMYIDDSFHYAKTRNTGAPKRNPQTNLNKL